MHTITKFTLWTAALLVVSAPQLASSASCNEAGFRCLGDTFYQLCLDGSTTTNTDALVCPGSLKCSADCYEPCLPASSTPCIKCNNGTNFLCAGETSFQMCTEESIIPYPEIYNCRNGTVCSDFCPNECSAKACNPVVCTIDGAKMPSKNPKNYHLCTQMPDGTFVTSEYPCPGTSLFNAQIEKCGPQASTTTTPRPTFVCPGVGRFPDPAGVNGYFLCALDGSALTASHFDCPAGTTFNKVTLKCSSSGATLTTPVAEFVCTETGKFADPTSCNNYIMCTSTDGIRLEATKYTCPTPSFYNPDTLKCTSTRPSSCPEVSRSAVSSTEFECPGLGRFEDPVSCNHYYLCVTEEDEEDYDNDFDTYHYQSFSFPCPGSSLYNPETQQCTYLDIPCSK